MTEIIDDVLGTQYLVYITIVQHLHLGRETDTVADWVYLILELKRHLAKVVVLLVNILLRANFLYSLSILEHRLNDLFIVLQSLFG